MNVSPALCQKDSTVSLCKFSLKEFKYEPDSFRLDLADASSLIYSPIDGKIGIVFGCHSWIVNNVIHHSENVITVNVASDKYKIALSGFSSVLVEENVKLVEGNRVGIVDSTISKLSIKVWRDGTVLSKSEALRILE